MFKVREGLLEGGEVRIGGFVIVDHSSAVTFRASYKFSCKE